MLHCVISFQSFHAFSFLVDVFLRKGLSKTEISEKVGRSEHWVKRPACVAVLFEVCQRYC